MYMKSAREGITHNSSSNPNYMVYMKSAREGITHNSSKKNPLHIVHDTIDMQHIYVNNLHNRDSTPLNRHLTVDGLINSGDLS